MKRRHFVCAIFPAVGVLFSARKGRTKVSELHQAYQNVLGEALPNCLAGFNLKIVAEDSGTDDHYHFRSYKLSCKVCDRTELKIQNRQEIAVKASPDFGIKPGDIMDLPPYSGECVACGNTAHIFDNITDGYDGVFKQATPYRDGAGKISTRPGTYEVAVTMTYNIDPDELLDHAQGAKVLPVDVFDWIEIKGKPVNGGTEFSDDYECA